MGCQHIRTPPKQIQGQRFRQIQRRLRPQSRAGDFGVRGRVVALGATPGQFFSFLTAFLLAYEPAKRLARLNIELNSSLIGAANCWRSSTVRPASPTTTTSRR